MPKKSKSDKKEDDDNLQDIGVDLERLNENIEQVNVNLNELVFEMRQIRIILDSKLLRM